MSHHNLPDALLPALTVYCTYLKHCTVNPASFSGTHLNKLIDDFAPALVEHLSDEILSFLSLSRFGSKLPLLNMIDRESKRSPLNLSITGGTPFSSAIWMWSLKAASGERGLQSRKSRGILCNGLLSHGTRSGGDLRAVMQMDGCECCLLSRLRASQ